MTPPPPPRIFILFASRADEAVVFRRGPSSWFHLLRWSTIDDDLVPGAWFRGQLYPERSDLSPDGKLLVYFASQQAKWRSSYSSAWTAVSRPPWLTALGLWPQGTTYGGGGKFIENRRVLLRAMSARPHPEHPATGLQVELGNTPHLKHDKIDGAEWAGRDRFDRLVLVRNGCIYRRPERGKEKLIADLNGLVPDPQPAPASAARPISRR